MQPVAGMGMGIVGGLGMGNTVRRKAAEQKHRQACMQQVGMLDAI